LYYAPLEGLAFLFGRRLATVQALAADGVFGPSYTEDGIERWPIFMGEKYFGRSVLYPERKQANKALLWLEDVMNTRRLTR
jgi:hypothetical protein